MPPAQSSMAREGSGQIINGVAAIEDFNHSFLTGYGGSNKTAYDS